MSKKFNLRNVVIVITCLAAVTMFSGCSKDKDGEDGGGGGGGNKPIGRVITAAELFSIADAERILGETVKDSNIDQRRECYDFLVYWLSPHSTGVYIYQEALYAKNDWQNYLQKMEDVYIDVGEKLDINDANVYLSEAVGWSFPSLQIFYGDYRISLNVMGGGNSEEAALWRREKVIEIGMLVLKNLKEVLNNE